MKRICRVMSGLLVIAGLAWSTDCRASAQPASLTVAQLKTNAAPQPLGLDDRTPRLRWALASVRRGVMQRAYRLIVASKPELAREGKADIWDSGQVASSDPWAIYAGPPLKSRTRYYWTVRVWATDGLASPWAEMTWFETALLSADEWKGQWIAGPERSGILTEAEGKADDDAIRAAGEFCRPVQWGTGGLARRVPNNQGDCREVRPTPMLRKSFQMTKPVARARVYAAGLAYNQLSVSGKPTSDKLVGIEGQRVVYEVGSGRYQFRVAR